MGSGASHAVELNWYVENNSNKMHKLNFKCYIYE